LIANRNARGKALVVAHYALSDQYFLGVSSQYLPTYNENPSNVAFSGLDGDTAI